MKLSKNEMWVIKRKSEIKKFENLNFILKTSFQKVKQDTDRINQWLNYFYHRFLQQESQIKTLKNQIAILPKTNYDFKKIFNEIHQFEALEKKIFELTQRIDSLSNSTHFKATKHWIPDDKIMELQKRLEKVEAKKQSFKDKIIKRIAKNSKDYIKSMIISYIKKYEKISAFQLKEMIVDEQKVCSKSSFYRILEEIETEFEHEISTIKQGKEKHYLGKLTKKI